MRAMEDGGGGSNTWKYVGIGCGVAVLLSLCAVGGCVACGAAGIKRLFCALNFRGMVRCSLRRRMG